MNGLRWFRVRCNLSTSELADQLGVTRQAVCSWESGKKRKLGMKIIIRK